jgi:hypothetical protein
VDLEGYDVHPTFDVTTHDNAHSDQLSFRPGDYKVPASRIDNTTALQNWGSFLESYINNVDHDNVSDSGSTDSSIPSVACNVCFSFLPFVS